ncbi:hypothetical protein KAJ38_03240 [Candidatus Pacearchaeota archaeon]|nr:hypothetical protein [Candidatus Pacearchaeota archaeon]
MVKSNKINILFVCKYNRFRSRIAAAYFRKINRNRKIRVKSAGVIEGSPINKNLINVAKEFCINIQGSPRGLSSKLLKWQDILIVAADDIPKDLFNLNNKYNKKTIFWKIRDTVSDNDWEVKQIIKRVINRVSELNKRLEK